MEHEGEIKTNIAETNLIEDHKPVRSPLSAESDISIKCGGNSIKSESSAADENTFQKGQNDAEDPHLYHHPAIDPIKAKLND